MLRLCLPATIVTAKTVNQQTALSQVELPSHNFGENGRDLQWQLNFRLCLPQSLSGLLHGTNISSGLFELSSPETAHR